MTNWETYLTYDWFRDIWLPAAGAILIPVAIAFFTWWFGASRAEKQKEMKELRDNLNLLLSVCLSSIIKVCLYRKEVIEINEQEQSKNVNIDDALQKISRLYCISHDFGCIDIAKYSLCIASDDNYVMSLIRVMTTAQLLQDRISHRNTIISKIFDVTNSEMRGSQLADLIKYDIQNYEGTLSYISLTLLSLRDFITETKDLEKKIKGLKLDTVRYSEEQKQLFAELEQKYAKEQEK